MKDTRDDVIKKYAHDFYHEKGKLYFKGSQRGKPKHKELGNVNKDGYLVTFYKGKSLLVHRIIFFIENGYLPVVVDHIDRCRTNNLPVNLRACSIVENIKNCSISKKNKSGVKNVFWHAASQKWAVSIMSKGVSKHLGVFETLEEAACVAKEHRGKMHGEFACHG